MVALYPDREGLKREHPELQDEDIRQVLEFAAGSLDGRAIMSGAACSDCCWTRDDRPAPLFFFANTRSRSSLTASDAPRSEAYTWV